MAYDLYPLSPSLKPYEPADSTYARYLNQSHAPLINLLKKALYSELCNYKWFDKPLKTSISHLHISMTLSSCLTNMFLLSHLPLNFMMELAPYPLNLYVKN